MMPSCANGIWVSFRVTFGKRGVLSQPPASQALVPMFEKSVILPSLKSVRLCLNARLTSHTDIRHLFCCYSDTTCYPRLAKASGDTSTTEYQYQSDLYSHCWQLRIWSLFISTSEEGSPELIGFWLLGGHSEPSLM